MTTSLVGLQLIVKSSHSCLFVLLDFCAVVVVSVVVVCPPSCMLSPTAEGGGSATRLACTPLSLCKLTVLLPSSSVRVVSAMLGGVAEGSTVLAALTPFICWISKVIFSVFIVSSRFVVAVGNRASTVNVQSSWFCSKRRRRLKSRCKLSHGPQTATMGWLSSLLLLGNAIATHALARIVDSTQNILCGQISSTYDASAYRNGRPIALEPSPSGG